MHIHIHSWRLSSDRSIFELSHCKNNHSFPPHEILVPSIGSTVEQSAFRNNILRLPKDLEDGWLRTATCQEENARIPIQWRVLPIVLKVYLHDEGLEFNFSQFSNEQVLKWFFIQQQPLRPQKIPALETPQKLFLSLLRTTPNEQAGCVDTRDLFEKSCRSEEHF